MNDLIFITESEAKRLEQLGLKPVMAWAIKRKDMEFISGLGGKKKKRQKPIRQPDAKASSPQAPTRAVVGTGSPARKALEFEVLQPNLFKGRQGDTQIGKCVEALLTGLKKGDVVSRSLFSDFPPWIPQSLVESKYLKVLKRVGE